MPKRSARKNGAADGATSSGGGFTTIKDAASKVIALRKMAVSPSKVAAHQAKDEAVDAVLVDEESLTSVSDAGDSVGSFANTAALGSLALEEPRMEPSASPLRSSGDKGHENFATKVMHQVMGTESKKTRKKNESESESEGVDDGKASAGAKTGLGLMGMTASSAEVQRELRADHPVQITILRREFRPKGTWEIGANKDAERHFFTSQSAREMGAVINLPTVSTEVAQFTVAAAEETGVEVDGAIPRRHGQGKACGGIRAAKVYGEEAKHYSLEALKGSARKDSARPKVAEDGAATNVRGGVAKKRKDVMEPWIRVHQAERSVSKMYKEPSSGDMLEYYHESEALSGADATDKQVLARLIQTHDDENDAIPFSSASRAEERAEALLKEWDGFEKQLIEHMRVTHEPKPAVIGGMEGGDQIVWLAWERSDVHHEVPVRAAGLSEERVREILKGYRPLKIGFCAMPADEDLYEHIGQARQQIVATRRNSTLRKHKFKAAVKAAGMGAAAMGRRMSHMLFVGDSKEHGTGLEHSGGASSAGSQGKASSVAAERLQLQTVLNDSAGMMRNADLSVGSFASSLGGAPMSTRIDEKDEDDESDCEDLEAAAPPPTDPSRCKDSEGRGSARVGERARAKKSVKPGCKGSKKARLGKDFRGTSFRAHALAQHAGGSDSSSDD